MRGIVQYEVYVLSQGRWSLHARYPGVQRADAVMDASNTEFATGHATKVVRDTYWPEINENEEVTTYLSPKARTLQAMTSRRKAVGLPVPTVAAYGRTGPVQTSRRRVQQVNALQRNVRMIVALGLSLFFASGLTAAASTALHRLSGKFELEQGTITILLTLVYLLIFTYVFRRTSRARMRLHQIIIEMWENADKPAVRYPPRRAMGRAYRNPTKRPWAPQERPATRREIEKQAQAAPAPPPPEIEPPAPPAPEPPAPVVVALEAATPSAPTSKAEKAEKAAEAKLAEAAAKKAQAAELQAAADDSSISFIPPAILEVPEGLSLERIILRRFAVDVVIPAIARAHRDDPVTRRGIALLIAGAVQGLVETNPVSHNGAMALLAEALREAGSRAAVIESFLGNYDANMEAPSTQGLILAGRKAIKGYVDGAQGVDRDIQHALSVWRFPSTARLVPAKPEFYLFSIAREESLTDSEPTTGFLLHSALVRAAVQEFSGTVIPHDSAGLLAHFGDAGAVFSAARAIQSRTLGAAGPGTATVIVEGPLTTPGVPEEVASILEHARELLAVTVDGEVVSDVTAHRSLGDDSPAVEPLEHRSDAVRLVAPAEAPALNPPH